MRPMCGVSVRRVAAVGLSLCLLCFLLLYTLSLHRRLVPASHLLGAGGGPVILKLFDLQQKAAHLSRAVANATQLASLSEGGLGREGRIRGNVTRMQTVLQNGRPLGVFGQTQVVTDQRQSGKVQSQGGKYKNQGGTDKNQGGKDQSQSGIDQSKGGKDKTQGGTDKHQGGKDQSQSGIDQSKDGADQIKGGADQIQQHTKDTEPLPPVVREEQCELLRKHSDNYVKKVASSGDPSSLKTNLCLELKPSTYIRNEARLFNESELDASRYGDRTPLIPHIIHQTWDSLMVPQPAVPFIKSVIQHHPSWEYWFWTQEDITCYMRTRHPDFLALYEDYREMIFKTDVFRYFILYDFGGFYMDLDVQALRPLDAFTHLASSLLSHETYEHTFFGHMREQPNVMTTVLATAPGHPYYKLLQENLARYHSLCPRNVLYSTGPFYIDNVYQLYMQAYATPQHPDITVIHPRYWLPTFARASEQKVKTLCRPGSTDKLTSHQRELCEIERTRNYENKPWPDSYLNHFWMNSNVKGSKFITSGKVNITELVPGLRSVRDRLGLKCH